MGDVTRLLERIEDGDQKAAEQLLPLVYDELRKLAARKMAQEQPGQTLEATALVHEAYMRLVGGQRPSLWDNRRHFFASAAEAMRRILVENARRKLGPKAGGGHRRVDVELDFITHGETSRDRVLVALSDALDRLAAEAPDRAELVKLRYFAGLTMAEAAEALGVSKATAERHWTFARAWLYAELSGEDPEPH